MSRPWMPFYVSDYIADTMHLGTLEHGAYVLLIAHYWRHGGLPDDDLKLARIVRATAEQWSEIRPALRPFFGEGWTHKRIDSELVQAAEKYARRASAGRSGGLASGSARRSNAPAMSDQTESNAEARLNQPQPEKIKEEGVIASSLDSSDEVRFWSRLEDLRAKGISRSQCTKLLKLTGGDFSETNRALEAAAEARRPAQYLGATIRNLEQGSRNAQPTANANVPRWVNDRRAAGIHVERVGQHWRCLGELYNDAGEVVGW